jgi:integrase
VASVYIVKRRISDGVDRAGRPVERHRYHVRMEVGRYHPVVHLAAWDTKKLAETHRMAVLMQLARGEQPQKVSAVAAPASSGTTIAQLGEAWVASRVDVEDSTRESYAQQATAIAARFGPRDPASITVDELRAWIAEMIEKPTAVGTIRLRLFVLTRLMRFAKIEPNPVKDIELRVPKAGPKQYRLPTPKQLAVLYATLAPKNVGCVRLMEHTGLRIHEATAVRYGHWDAKRKRLFVPESKTSAGVRFVDQLDGLPEIPKRPAGRSGDDLVWPDITNSSVREAMSFACKNAGLPRFSPHDLRHLHLSRLLHGMILSPAQIAARAGHASPEITLRTYSHVLPPEDDDQTETAAHEDVPFVP